MQEELLEKNDDRNVRVYAVWFSMYPTDQRDRWPADVLTDARVTHWWDEQKTVGRWYMDRIDEITPLRAPDSSGVGGNVLWDAYLVYGTESRWDEAPSGLRRWGRTVLGTQEAFREAFQAAVKSSSSN